MNTIQRISILGANGLVAKETIKGFANAGYQLTLLSRSIEANAHPNHLVVKGDVFNDKDLSAALKGADAVHITLGQLDEFAAVKKIVAAAKTNNIQLITYISGATVCKKNTSMPFIEAKYKAEQLIKNCGIPYMIFRPTWFMESLALMVQDKKATIIGKQPLKIRWIAARDFAQMLVEAYKNKACYHQEFSLYGPEALTMNEALESYCKVKHPAIKKVANAPFGLLKIIAFITGNKQLKTVIPLFRYFEKTKEAGSAKTADLLLGKASTTLKEWLRD